MHKFSPRSVAARILSEQVQQRGFGSRERHCIFFALQTEWLHTRPLKRDGYNRSLTCEGLGFDLADAGSQRVGD